MIRAVTFTRASACAIWILLTITSLASLSASAVYAQDEKAATLQWKPPHEFETVPGISAIPACDLDAVLAKAGKGAEILIDNLQNFDAHERVRFESIDNHMVSTLYLRRKYDYQVNFGEQIAPFHVIETRTPLEQGDSGIDTLIDRGLVALALVFHPTLQSDYEMKCDGFARRHGRGAWVVSFVQIEGKVPRAISLLTSEGPHPIAIRGRAWIAESSGQVIHLETYLMAPVPELGLRTNATSLDYAPVKFQTRNLELWLPQSALVYANYGKHRTIIEHTFSNFQLFSVETRQVVEAPR